MNVVGKVHSNEEAVNMMLHAESYKRLLIRSYVMSKNLAASHRLPVV